jgi:hypothetical protein
LIETEQQRRWWFATHPEFSRNSPGQRRNTHDDDDKADKRSQERADAWVDRLIKQTRDDYWKDVFREVKSQYGPESTSTTLGLKHTLLGGDEGRARSDNEIVKWPFRLPRVPNPLDVVRDMLDYFGRNHPVFMSDPNRPSEPVTRAIRGAAEIARVAAQISKGHAYDKHVVEQDEFPEVVDRKQFRNLIQKILSDPTDWKRLEGGRSAYWDKETGTVVIRDPRDPDGGTAFRPDTGKRYYDENLK